jgi:hypothetical protein
MSCPCNKNGKIVKTIIHSKGLYTKPYKKPCDDCTKKNTQRYSITSNKPVYVVKRRGI